MAACEGNTGNTKILIQIKSSMKQESLEMFLECCLATSTINIVMVIIIIIIIIIDWWADHSAWVPTTSECCCVCRSMKDPSTWRALPSLRMETCCLATRTAICSSGRKVWSRQPLDYWSAEICCPLLCHFCAFLDFKAIKRVTFVCLFLYCLGVLQKLQLP